MSDGKQIWLVEAHRVFARQGESGLKIDHLAGIVGKSRSSFYHLFPDMETFMDALIEYDLELTERFSRESAPVERFFPDYAELLVKYKDMLFFNRHLFVGRHGNSRFAQAWDRVTELADDKTEALWMKMVNLEDLPSEQREQFYLTIRTAAFMRLDYEKFDYDHIYQIVNGVNRSFGFLLDHE